MGAVTGPLPGSGEVPRGMTAPHPVRGLRGGQAPHRSFTVGSEERGQPVSRAEGRRASVLVVEDDESAATFVTRVLQRAGITSVWTIDAEHASDLLATESFDVLLTDIRLPGRSGLDLAQEARANRPGIGIAMMTSYNEAGLERRARSLGADDFFEKPLTPSSLVSRIVSLLERPGGGGSDPTPRRGGRRAAKNDRTPASGSSESGAGSGAGTGTGSARRNGSASSGDSGGPVSASMTATVHTIRRARSFAHPLEAPRVAVLSEIAPGIRRLGPAPAPPAGIALFASVTPVVSHIVSGAGPVRAPRTSGAWAAPR